MWPMRAGSDKRMGGMSRLEWGIIAGGLAGGLLLGGILFHGRTPPEKAEAVAAVQTPVAAPVESRSVDREAELDLLKRRIAELQQLQLEEQAVAEESAEVISDATLAEELTADDPAEIIPAGSTAVDSADGGAEPPVSAAVRTKTSAGETTLAYWNRLNDVIAKEAAMRAAPANVTAGNAAGFVDARLQAGRFASGALRELDATGVDPEVVAISRELVAWYDEEVTLNTKAQTLLKSSDIAARKGGAGSSWRAGEERHQRTCAEINRRAAELRTRLTARYGLEFPPLN